MSHLRADIASLLPWGVSNSLAQKRKQLLSEAVEISECGFSSMWASPRDLPQYCVQSVTLNCVPKHLRR